MSDKIETGDGTIVPPSLAAAGGWCAPSETIYDLTVGSREQQLWRGEVEPTPEERQAAADELYAQEVLDNRNWFDTGVFLEKVKNYLFGGLAQQILDLHEHDEVGHFCSVCVTDWETSVEWPCATARVVLKDVGIEVPDELIYEKPALVVQDPDNPRWPFPAEPVDVLGLFDIPEVSARRGGITFGKP